MTLIPLEDDGDDAPLPEEEVELLALREALIAHMQDDAPIENRLNTLLAAVDFALPNQDWPAIYRSLERLDPLWDSMLDRLPHVAEAFPRQLEQALTNFTVYLLYRHLPGALEDDDIPGRVAFCVLSAQMLMALCAATPDCTLADCLDLARMYSAEIEYSEDNIAALLDALWEDT